MIVGQRQARQRLDSFSASEKGFRVRIQAHRNYVITEIEFDDGDSYYWEHSLPDFAKSLAEACGPRRKVAQK